MLDPQYIKYRTLAILIIFICYVKKNFFFIYVTRKNMYDEGFAHLCTEM